MPLHIGISTLHLGISQCHDFPNSHVFNASSVFVGEGEQQMSILTVRPGEFVASEEVPSLLGTLQELF